MESATKIKTRKSKNGVNRTTNEDKTELCKGDVPNQRIRLGAAEYSKMTDQDDSSDNGESEAELDLIYSNEASLNLSKRRIKKFPKNLLSRMNRVQYLYLEGNKLSELPKCFFQNLQNLKWLDLRNNRLTYLPTVGLKNHPTLEFILLQGNRVRNLPVELGTVSSLKGLQVSGNPITNVPYDVIAEGFQSLIKHLQKLHYQEEVLLSYSESVVVKPSTSKGNSQSHPKPAMKEPSDSELRMWDMDELSQWRQFMKKRSQAPYCITKLPKASQPKFSVSVRSQPKRPPKPQPFRCGFYNRNRRKISSSALHYLKMRKTKFGYRRKPITPALLQEKARKEAFRAQLRETLEKQAKQIQRMKDKETLKSWRDYARYSREHIKLLDNFQQYPSKDFASKIPFDVDPDFLNMLNRVDIYRSLKDFDNRRRKIRKPKAKISALDLERQMNEIMEKLQALSTNDNEDKSPRTHHKHVCDKMHKIRDIQKTLKNLQTLNSSVSGLMPIIKTQSKNYLPKK